MEHPFSLHMSDTDAIRLRDVNAKLLAALERAQWFIHDNICAPGEVEDCMQEVCNVAHAAIEEARK